MGGCQSLHHAVRQGSLETLRTTCVRARNVNITEQVESLQVRNPTRAHSTCQFLRRRRLLSTEMECHSIGGMVGQGRRH